jgi:alanine dehydrogenase
VTTLATLGVDRALREDPGLAAGVSVYRGEIVNAQLARAMGGHARQLRTLLPKAGSRP